MSADNSSPSKFLAACCGPSVYTWNCANASEGGETTTTTPLFEPFSAYSTRGSLQDVAWNHNGNVIATCTSNTVTAASTSLLGSSSTSLSNNKEPLVVLTNANEGTELDSLPNLGKDDLTPTSISFGGRSRYLSISSNEGTVTIWDLKKRARVRIFYNSNDGNNNTTKSFKSMSSIQTKNIIGGFSQACFDPTDCFVGAISSCPKDGALRLFKLRESSLVSTFFPSSGRSHYGSAKALTFSKMIKSQVSVGMQNGTVLVWDIQQNQSSSSTTIKNKNGLIASFDKSHTKEVTGLAFSPINRLLLASCSLDGTIVFHDVKSQGMIQKLKPEIPMMSTTSTSSNNNISHSSGRILSSTKYGISCLSLHSDGITCAAGTTSGHIAVYDLRKASNGPISTKLLSSEFPVNGLQFQSSGNSSNNINGSINGTTKPVDSKHISQPDENGHSDVKELYPNNTNATMSNHHNHQNLSVDIASPQHVSSGTINSPTNHNLESTADHIVRKTQKTITSAITDHNSTLPSSTTLKSPLAMDSNRTSKPKAYKSMRKKPNEDSKNASSSLSNINNDNNSKKSLSSSKLTSENNDFTGDISWRKSAQQIENSINHTMNHNQEKKHGSVDSSSNKIVIEKVSS